MNDMLRASACLGREYLDTNRSCAAKLLTKPSIVKPGFFMENFSGMLGPLTVYLMKAGLNPRTHLDLVVYNQFNKIPDPSSMLTVPRRRKI